MDKAGTLQLVAQLQIPSCIGVLFMVHRLPHSGSYQDIYRGSASDLVGHESKAYPPVRLKSVKVTTEPTTLSVPVYQRQQLASSSRPDHDPVPL
ncbi:MAG TPA: hypothetical protein VKJ45_26320 [Blastocatellia bacterium]|nr:hypothetical protein [Blastocatellia bacterium]